MDQTPKASSTPHVRGAELTAQSIFAAVIVAAIMGVGFSYSLLNVGSGMIIGLRVSFWLAAGGALGWIVAPLLLVQNGLLPDHPTRTQVLYFVMWPGIGMVMAAGMTILIVRWRLLAEAFRARGGASVSREEFPLSLVVIGIVLLAGFLCYPQALYFGPPIWMTVVAIIFSIPL